MSSYAAGTARRSRGPRTQPQERHRCDAARPADRHHGPLRLGQEQPCLRHHLCRGPAPLRREPVRVCPPIPRRDAEAGCRSDRRPLPGNLDRPERCQPKPAVDSRHGDRDLRPPEAPVRADRPPALSHVRPRNRAPVGPADRRPDLRPARGHAPDGPGTGHQGPQDGRQPRVRADSSPGLRPRQSRRRADGPGRDPAAGQVQAPHDRRRGGPLHRAPWRNDRSRRRRSGGWHVGELGGRSEPPGLHSPGGLGGDGAAARRGSRAHRPCSA